MYNIPKDQTKLPVEPQQEIVVYFESILIIYYVDTVNNNNWYTISKRFYNYHYPSVDIILIINKRY